MPLLAFFLPCLIFIIIGRPGAAILSLLLQFTLIGWIPAAIWAAYALGRHNTAVRYTRAYYPGYYR